ncbi:thioredoxin family protein [Clostridium sp. JN-1]|jgi:thioredoxin-like negative regulator of GroEL|uniref:thioredoxin family protein n=1 Tax=Clostridium sp. JN-1 TaxID=2483110 RepID=UPI001FA9D77D|nr:thioredoxin family protein [Clostridium sp. JN-1]
MDTNEDIKELLKNNEIVLVYFGSNNCNVCAAMKPKIEELLKDYPKIKSTQVDIEKSLEVSAAYNIFTIPAILLFIEGKETIREAKYISLEDVDSKIGRYYNMLFE